MNCVAFVDPFGCCPKFQCDGDTMKPGHCPGEVEAMKFMARFNTTNMMLHGPGGYPLGPGMPGPGMMMGPGSGAGAVAGHVEIQAGAPQAEAVQQADGAPPVRLAVEAGGFIQYPNTGNNMMACVGDFNCPGTMKCCSNDMNVYVKDGHYFFRNRNPTYGYCMEPGATTPGMNTKSIKYTVQ
jgi:hypothetical protein